MTRTGKAIAPKVAALNGKIASKSQSNIKPSPTIKQEQDSFPLPTLHQEQTLHRILKTNKGLSTFDARKLGINHPAGRVNSLRNKGVSIETHFITEVSQTGKAARIAFYVLVKNPQLQLPGFGGASQQSREVSHESR